MCGALIRVKMFAGHVKSVRMHILEIWCTRRICRFIGWSQLFIKLRVWRFWVKKWVCLRLALVRMDVYIYTHTRAHKHIHTHATHIHAYTNGHDFMHTRFFFVVPLQPCILAITRKEPITRAFMLIRFVRKLIAWLYLCNGSIHVHACTYACCEHSHKVLFLHANAYTTSTHLYTNTRKESRPIRSHACRYARFCRPTQAYITYIIHAYIHTQTEAYI